MVWPHLHLIEKSHKKIPAEIRDVLLNEFQNNQDGFFRFCAEQLGHDTFWLKASRKEFEKLVASITT